MTVLFLLWIACAGLCAFIGDRKGRSVGKFTLIGLAFGVFGVVYAACARTAERKAAYEAAALAEYRGYGTATRRR